MYKRTIRRAAVLEHPSIFRQGRTGRRRPGAVTIWPAEPGFLLPDPGEWDRDHPDMIAAMQRGLDQAARGEISYLGSCGRYWERGDQAP